MISSPVLVSDVKHNLFENLLCFTLFLILFRILFLIYDYITSSRALPPGPKCLPLFGYLPFLGSDPHKTVTRLSETFGNVFSLQLGVRRFVVLNNWKAVKEGLHSDQLLARPHITPATIVDPNLSIVDENGSVWRRHRQFAHQAFKSLGVGTGLMEDRISEEISHLVGYIDDSDGHDFSVHHILSASISNNVSQLVFGHRFQLDDPIMTNILTQMERFQKHFSNISLLCVSPLRLSRLFLKIDYWLNYQNIQIIDEFFANEITEHKRDFDNNNRDYIDCYLTEMQNRMKAGDSSMSESQLMADCFAFFPSRTSVIIIEWCLLFLAHYKQFQNSMHEEIDAVIGRDRRPSSGDRPHLPFTQAFINEIYRYRTNTPFSLMRRAIDNTTISGQLIPKDTDILVNIWSVHNDPKVWSEPNRFNPNRFLSDDGKHVIKSEALIPFSIGKRSCIAEALGRMDVFLYLTAILQRYTVCGPTHTTLSLEEKFGLLLEPKDEVILRFQRRSNL